MAYWIAMGLVAGGVLIIAMVIIGVVRGRSRSAMPEVESAEAPRPVRPSETSAPPPGATSLATVQEAEQLLRLMGEAEELCSRLTAQLDAKSREVEALLARAENVRRAEEAVSDESAALAQAQAEVRGMPARQAGLVSRAEPPTIVTRPITPPVPVATSAVAAVERHEGLDALANQVYTLADRGLGAQDIARTLREHPGKIELILALRTR